MAQYYPYVPPRIPLQYEAGSGKKLNYDPMMRGYIQGQIPGMEYATERGRLLDIDEERELERQREAEAELALRERELATSERLGAERIGIAEDSARQARRSQLLGLGTSAAGLGLEVYKYGKGKWWGKGAPEIAEKGGQTIPMEKGPTGTYQPTTPGVDTTLPGSPSGGPGLGMGLASGAGTLTRGLEGMSIGAPSINAFGPETFNVTGGAPVGIEGMGISPEAIERAGATSGLRSTLSKYAPYAGIGLGAYGLLEGETPEQKIASAGGIIGGGLSLAGVGPLAATGVGALAALPAAFDMLGITSPGAKGPEDIAQDQLNAYQDELMALHMDSTWTPEKAARIKELEALTATGSPLYAKAYPGSAKKEAALKASAQAFRDKSRAGWETKYGKGSYPEAWAILDEYGAQSQEWKDWKRAHPSGRSPEELEAERQVGREEEATRRAALEKDPFAFMTEFSGRSRRGLGLPKVPKGGLGLAPATLL